MSRSAPRPSAKPSKLKASASTSNGAADPAQRVDAADLAALAGVDIPSDELLPQPDDGSGRYESFLRQLGEDNPPAVSHGTIVVLDDWVRRGGELQYGLSEETSCFLMCRAQGNNIWPFAIYPAGRVEVVFQYLKDRPPFDDDTLREEFRTRLNAANGVELPAGKIALRPGFDLEVLGDQTARQHVIDALDWFWATVLDASPASPTATATEDS